MSKAIKAPFVRNPYNYDTNAASDEDCSYVPTDDRPEATSCKP